MLQDFNLFTTNRKVCRNGNATSSFIAIFRTNIRNFIDFLNFKFKRNNKNKIELNKIKKMKQKNRIFFESTELLVLNVF